MKLPQPSQWSKLSFKYSRPLTYTSSDIDDLRPLTPSHFLCGFRLTNLPEVKQAFKGEDEQFLIKETTKKDITSRVKYLERLMSLASLRQRYDSAKCTQQVSTTKVGEVVLVQDDLPRNRRGLGIVEKTFPGIKGFVRSANVKSSDDKILRCAIEKLYPLEIYHEPEEPIQVEARRP